MTHRLLYLGYPALILAWLALLIVSPSGPFSRPARKSFEQHPVHDDRRSRAERIVGRHAPSFTARDQHHKQWSLAELASDRPLVLVFIHKDCPCNVEAEPWFQRVARLYADESRFAGVFQGNAEDALAYARRHGVAYPLLTDPEGDIIGAYEVATSASVVLVDSRMRIRGSWPGFSQTMFQELAVQIAEIAGIEPRPLDVSDAPAAMFTGCRFESK